MFGETGPLKTFRSPGRLVAFYGLDLMVFQTGQYGAARRRISKPGSPALRNTMW
ncbi:MAG: transposase [Phycisphaerales bacterium]|nr:MAG: transposase [Phycisphaerales bacterium]